MFRTSHAYTETQSVREMRLRRCMRHFRFIEKMHNIRALDVDGIHT